MKRLTLLTLFVLLCLQFTCGHAVKEAKPTDCPQPEDSQMNVAVSALNNAHCEFWQLSYRIDSLLSIQQSGGQYRKPIEAMRASDPVHY